MIARALDALSPAQLRAALAQQGHAHALSAEHAPNMRLAAVVVPLRLGPSPIAFAMVRAAALADHPGEVAFPGGKHEAQDTDLRATAFREALEEVGLGEEALEEVGTLRPVPVITGRFRIHPFVAAVRAGHAPRIASTEIARLIEVPLAAFITGEKRIGAIDATWRGVELRVPHFDLDGCVLYGASAYLFYELLGKLAAHLGAELPPMVVQPDAPWGERYRDLA